MAKAMRNNVKVHLPKDFLVGSIEDKDQSVLIGDLQTGIPEGLLGLDIGPKTSLENNGVIMNAKTIVWNGP